MLLAILISSFIEVTPAPPQSAAGARSGWDAYLTRLPAGLKLRERGPSRYAVSCDYFILDARGNFMRKERISASYTRALPGGKARWENVRIALASGLDDSFGDGELQSYMEGFTYTLSDSKQMLSKDFFTGFPAGELRTRNLLWDTHMIEGFGWDYFDKLSLNTPYRIQAGPEDVPLAGAGTFRNRNIELTWLGISKRNSAPCALIRYQAFFNTFNVTTAGIDSKGLSHYWGEIWVSLETKQIEHATLNEDVLVEVAIPGQPSKMLINVFRVGAFQKN